MKIACSLVVGLSLLIAGGCISDNTSGGEISTAGGVTSVRFEDTFFKQHLRVEATSFVTAESGYKVATVRLRNAFQKDFQFLYKFAWFDANGIEIMPDSRPWENRILHGGEAATLTATAPAQNTDHFVIRFRRMK